MFTDLHAGESAPKFPAALTGFAAAEQDGGGLARHRAAGAAAQAAHRALAALPSQFSHLAHQDCLQVVHFLY